MDAENNMDAKYMNNYIFVDAAFNLLGKYIKKGISSITIWGITLKNNESQDIMKVIKSLENRGILLKGATTKFISVEGGFLKFLRPLMTAGLQLKKSVLIPLAKNALLFIRIINRNVSSRCTYLKNKNVRK